MNVKRGSFDYFSLQVITIGISIGAGIHGISHLACDFPRLLHATTDEYEPMEKYFGEQAKSYRDFLKHIEGDEPTKASKQAHWLQCFLVFSPSIFLIDGPYGAPAQDYKKYEVVLLVGLGIGVTPVISIVKDIVNNIKSMADEEEEEGISMHNKTRIMNEVAEMDHHHEIELHNYCTSVYEEGDARSVLITMLQSLNHAKNGVDVISGTHVKSHFAKPNWHSVYKYIDVNHNNARVGVFYCGGTGSDERATFESLDVILVSQGTQNIRGLGRPEKLRALQRLTFVTKANVVLIQESKLMSLKPWISNRICGSRFSLLAFSPSDGASVSQFKIENDRIGDFRKNEESMKKKNCIEISA
ncbi:hypothetical protein F3Y22_tig00111330pilonHSYRG00858 [Hibiscus syriacus]|uniref:Ferric reductase NAD binding domain-containing protein n=1 Tax=Hibiscus syriacus TaxID=106335 RepID=A0A6A2YQ11_HIBSY|nr:hypothetical protein F3Y22_tig00111330pilonHSYRG00858 [Hibiscus syriacus]